MGLTAGVAFVTAAEVAAITQEPGLASLDQGSDATLANVLAQATTAIVGELRRRGVAPDRVSVAETLELLKHAAAWWCAWRKFAGSPVSGPGGDVNTRKAQEYKQAFQEAITSVVLSVNDSTGAAGSVATPLGRPTVGNFEPHGTIGAPTDSREPGRWPQGPWTSGA